MLPMVCANTMRLTKGHAGGSRCRLRRPVRGTSELFFGLNCPPGNSTRGPRRLDGVVETCDGVERTPPLLHRPGGRRQQYDHVEGQPVILLRLRNCSASLRQPPRFRVRLPGKPTYAAMGGGHRLIRLVDGNVEAFGTVRHLSAGGCCIARQMMLARADLTDTRTYVDIC